MPDLKPGMKIRLKVPSGNLAAPWIRHRNFEIYTDQTDFSIKFAADATFIVQLGLSGH